jgi:hypothetical protein
MKRLLLELPLLVGLLGIPVTTQTRQWTPESYPVYPRTRGPFYVESYTGKCLTYGTGLIEIDFEGSTPQNPIEIDFDPSTAIYTDDCSSGGGSLPGQFVQQQVVAKELNANHEVYLQAGNKVVGVVSNDLVDGRRLELQNYTGAPGQIWVLDGDSLILKANRNLVAEVKYGRTPRGTPVVLGRRDLDDSEFWTFAAVDGTNKKPTTGFVTVSNGAQLKAQVDAASWGTVIEIDQNASIPIDGFALQLKAGVTLRGNRRGTTPGPELTLDSYPQRNAIDIVGDYARVTGIRLRGPSPTKAEEPYSNGVFVDDQQAHWAIVDHNDMSGWTEAAVHVNYYSHYNSATDLQCDPPPTPIRRPRTVRVFRNFLHHNARAGLGYGVTIYANGFATILGNTFLYNRHAIAADGIAGTGYGAFDNLVLSDGPEYGVLGIAEHDFDMHGSDDSSHHTGGIAGSDVTMVMNTFLGTDRRNYDVRGIPCRRHSFQSNVSRQSQNGTIHWYGQTPTAPPPSWLAIAGNWFSSPDPTRTLGTGDFDGDGRQDLFLATGAAWYYAPAGLTEWRYLKEDSAERGDLLFGDVDGDGRTDVVIKHGGVWLVSWAGASEPERINERDGAINDFALGDFNGDGRADLFHTNGSRWLISYGSTTPFTVLYPSPYRLADLRLGDFNGDGQTDVFAVIGDSWFARYSGNSSWSRLRSALTSSVANVLVADFDGNGRSDVALSNSSTWKVSFNGIEDWASLRSSWAVSLKDAAGIADFDGTPGAEVLGWELPIPSPDLDSRYLDIVPRGFAAPYRHSRNHMR